MTTSLVALQLYLTKAFLVILGLHPSVYAVPILAELALLPVHKLLQAIS